VPPDEYVDWFRRWAANVQAVWPPTVSWFVNIKAHAETADATSTRWTWSCAQAGSGAGARRTSSAGARPTTECLEGGLPLQERLGTGTDLRFILHLIFNMPGGMLGCLQRGTAEPGRDSAHDRRKLGHGVAHRRQSHYGFSRMRNIWRHLPPRGASSFAEPVVSTLEMGDSASIGRHARGEPRAIQPAGRPCSFRIVASPPWYGIQQAGQFRRPRPDRSNADRRAHLKRPGGRRP